MAPYSYARNKRWFLLPWTVEREDPKHWAYVAPEKPVPGEDGDGEVRRDSEIMPLEEETMDGDGANLDPDMSVMDIDVDMSIVDASLDDREEILRLAEEECRDAISQMLDSAEPSPPMPPSGQNHVQKIELVVEYKGRAIYKSTLIGELNGNPFLSKDRLTRIKNSIYFNNAEDYLSAANSTSTALLGLGSDCGVLFMQSPTLGLSSGVRAAQMRNRNSAHVGHPTAVTVGSDIGTWWLGRVQKMRRTVGKTWRL